MNDSTPITEEPRGPLGCAILVAVVITVVAGIILLIIEVSFAEDYYRTSHTLPDVTVRGWFSSWTEQAPVTIDMLGVPTVLLLVGLAALYSILLHPVIGRFVVQAIQNLTKLVDSVYRFEADEAWSKWDPSVSLVVGSAWPITVIAIPLLLIALVIGHVYRALWQW